MSTCLSLFRGFRIASMLVLAIVFLQASILISNSGQASAQSPMMMPTMSAMPSSMPSMPPFFDGGMSMGGGMYYMTCADKNPFGYYSLSFMPWLYHVDMGWEYFIDAANSAHGGFMWDQKMGVFFYTDPEDFPFMYNFGKGAWYYYAPDPDMSGHYTTNPRLFFDFGAGKWVSS